MQTCIVKVGKPGELAECGLLCEYLTEKQASEQGLLCSGWRHADRNITDHHAVPKSWI